MMDSDSDFGELLTLTALRVELRLYSSTRTSSDYMGSPPHFKYCIRCDWSPEPAGCEWWSSLPSSYTIRRSWSDLEQFHRTIRHLAYDQEAGCRRVKAQVPNLPEEGDLNQFVSKMASVGDAGALSREGLRMLPRGAAALPRDCISSLEELDDMHRGYLEKHLRPYFAQISRVLCELPREVIRASPGLRRFVSSSQGVVLPKPSNPAHELRFRGLQQPLLLDRSAAVNVVKHLQRARTAGGLSTDAARFPDSPLSPLPPIKSQKTAGGVVRTGSAPALPR